MSTPVSSASAPSAQALAEQRELRDAVAALASRLPPDEARFLRLHLVDGLSYPEIAADHEISVGRCKYLKGKVVARALRDRQLLRALGRGRTGAT